MFAGGQKSRAVFAELSLRAPDVLILVSHLAGWDVVMSARMISEVRCIHFFFLFLGGGGEGVVVQQQVTFLTMLGLDLCW